MSKLTVHHLQVGQGERVPWLLEELGIPYELKLYQRSPFLSPPELVAKHPIGASPILEDATFDSEAPLELAESGAIVEYIIHKHGSGRLALQPSHPNFANYLYWFHFPNATLMSKLLRRLAIRAMMSSEEDPRYQSECERIRRALGHINDQLSSNNYLAGDEFTAADIMMMFCLTTMRQFEPMDLTDYPGIEAWLKRCYERPAYQKAMKRSDPDLDLEAGISAKGPPLFPAFAALKAQKK